MTHDEEIDRLYGLPAEQFVAERDALAKRLRADGDREAAGAVKKLPKPSRAAAVVNRLVRERPDEVQALVAAGEALAGAQEELLGGADATVLRGAADAARALVDALVAGAGVDGPTAEKVRATLHAATVDPDVRAEVAAGRVVKERAAVGFGGLEALAAALPAGAETAAKARSTKTKAKGRQAKRRPEPQPEPEPPKPDPREVRRRRDDLRRAKAAEATAQDAVAGARRALEQVEATMTARRRDLEAAEAALSETRERRRRAERAAEQAERA